MLVFPERNAQFQAVSGAFQTDFARHGCRIFAGISRFPEKDFG